VQYWKVYCMEDSYPGLWQRWFTNQCVAVGWCAKWGYHLDGSSECRSWSGARNGLKLVAPGDFVVVQLADSRVGRIGEVVHKRVGDDEWNPLVPPSLQEPDGEMGRRILVRWDLTAGPPSPDMVVELPAPKRLPTKDVRATIRPLDAATFQSIKEAMEDETNWVSLLAHFEYERSLSDYIATFPHRLEDGLQPYPSAKVREKVFPDRTRSDVLLIDRKSTPVVVECKQGAPTLENIRQLQGYMKHVHRETEKQARGILIHGGAQKLREDVRRECERDGRIEIIQYSLGVEFARCK